MKVSAAYGPGKFGLSYELFPPKTPASEEALFGHVRQLMEFDPSYVTCTYGAGGTTRDKTLHIVDRVKQRFDVPVAAHLTCVGSTVDQLRAYLVEARQCGIDNIVALRGDPPQGQTRFESVDGGLTYANQLASLIRNEFPEFGIAVAGYPETHREAPSPEADLENLRQKVAAGADVVITQLFYDNDVFFSFRERYGQLGISAPLVPGILPVTNFAQIQRISALCGAELPGDLIAAMQRQKDEAGQFQIGVEFAIRQVQGLIDGGVPGIHFYVLNKSQATSRVLQTVKLPR